MIKLKTINQELLADTIFFFKEFLSIFNNFHPRTFAIIKLFFEVVPADLVFAIDCSHLCLKFLN